MAYAGMLSTQEKRQGALGLPQVANPDLSALPVVHAGFVPLGIKEAGLKRAWIPPERFWTRFGTPKESPKTPKNHFQGLRETPKKASKCIKHVFRSHFL